MTDDLPKRYTWLELVEMSLTMTEDFVRARHEAENHLAERYHESFEKALKDVEAVFKRTEALRSLSSESGQELLISGYLQTLRNMCRPTVSEDDFKNLSDTGTVSASKFSDIGLSQSALDYLERNLNRDIFSWLDADTAPTDSERHAAAVAVAALAAEQKTKTLMRGSSSKRQEQAVREALIARCGLKSVASKSFELLSNGPGKGELFDRETLVAGTKADVVLGLYDGRIMCLECKVSNSEVNSFKRLNHEAVDKVKKWAGSFGKQCVSGVVIQGCFKAANLVSAQDDGAYLFCSSNLTPLIDFINGTKSE